jgi:hypothetical protein
MMLHPLGAGCRYVAVDASLVLHGARQRLRAHQHAGETDDIAHKARPLDLEAQITRIALSVARS